MRRQSLEAVGSLDFYLESEESGASPASSGVVRVDSAPRGQDLDVRRQVLIGRAEGGDARTTREGGSRRERRKGPPFELPSGVRWCWQGIIVLLRRSLVHGNMALARITSRDGSTPLLSTSRSFLAFPFFSVLVNLPGFHFVASFFRLLYGSFYQGLLEVEYFSLFLR